MFFSCSMWPQNNMKPLNEIANINIVTNQPPSTCRENSLSKSFTSKYCTLSLCMLKMLEWTYWHSDTISLMIYILRCMELTAYTNSRSSSSIQCRGHLAEKQRVSGLLASKVQISCCLLHPLVYKVPPCRLRVSHQTLSERIKCSSWTSVRLSRYPCNMSAVGTWNTAFWHCSF